MFFKWVDPPCPQKFATLPYIKGLTEPLTRLLRSHDIQVTNKPIKTLQQEFPAPKFHPKKKINAILSTKFLAPHVRGVVQKGALWVKNETQLTEK